MKRISYISVIDIAFLYECIWFYHHLLKSNYEIEDIWMPFARWFIMYMICYYMECENSELGGIGELPQLVCCIWICMWMLRHCRSCTLIWSAAHKQWSNGRLMWRQGPWRERHQPAGRTKTWVGPKMLPIAPSSKMFLFLAAERQRLVALRPTCD